MTKNKLTEEEVGILIEHEVEQASPFIFEKGYQKAQEDDAKEELEFLETYVKSAIIDADYGACHEIPNWYIKRKEELKNKIINSQRKKDKYELQNVDLSGATKLKQGKKVNTEDRLGVNGNHADTQTQEDEKT